MYLGTSWKMNKTRPEAVAWVKAVRKGLDAETAAKHHVFVAPPFTALDAVAEAIGDYPLLLGAQNVSEHDAGAWTGEVAAEMLAELGCELVVIGHSERRSNYAESDKRVAAKAAAAAKHKLRPLLCVGESAEVREAGDALDWVLEQAQSGLGQVADRSRCLLAYEPVWAIGAGATPATPEQVEPVVAALRAAHPDTPILYGGSVNADSAASLVSETGVDGLFVGRAALDPAGFLAVAAATLH